MPDGGMHAVLAGVSHRYGDVQALSQIDLEFLPGEVHALVGENGAGKSTLVKILAGLIHPDSGSIEINGRPTRFRSRNESAGSGIGVVHQHLSLVRRLTVAEHMLLGRPEHFRRLDMKWAREMVSNVGKRIGLDVAPDSRVDELPISTRQLVEIATALAWGADLLILDEPTAVLGPLESAALLEVVQGLRHEFNTTVLLISHKLRDVLAVGDRITVFRGGKVVASRMAAGATVGDLARAMIGADIVPLSQRVRPPESAPILVLTGVAAGRLQGVDLEVAPGEVVGVAGIAGSGQNELLESVAGLRRLGSGRIRIDGRRVDGDPGESLRARVAYIPEDRHRDAVVSHFPLWANGIAKRSHDRRLCNRGFLDPRRVKPYVARFAAGLRVHPNDPNLPLGSLSGGNQQRFVVARELDGNPRVVLAAEPTRGLDPQSAIEVRQHIMDAADAAAAVLVTSSDLDELFDMASRIVVLHSGRVTLDVAREDADRHLIGLAMGGAYDGQD